MASYLVVAHQTAASTELIEQLQRIQQEDAEADFVLLVPATPPRQLWTWVEGDDQFVARNNASRAAARLREAGLPLRDTAIGPSDPMKAISAELAREDRAYKAIVLSTLPAGISRWLRSDLPNQVRRRFGLRVIGVIARAEGMPETAERTPPQRARAVEPDWQHPTFEDLARMRGSEVHCVDGRIGRITEVLYDYATLEPVWIGIASRPLPFRTLLIPAQVARIEAGRLIVPFTQEKVHGQPHIEIGEGIPSLTEEEHIYAYFGLPHEAIREIRVLHSGDPFPGTQWSYQPIFEQEPTVERER